MSSHIDKKIEELEQSLKDQKKKLESSFKISTIFYACFVVFVFAYTVIVAGQIKSKATPKVIAAHLHGMVVENMGKIEENLVASSEEQAPTLVKAVFDAAHGVIPKAEGMLKTHIDVLVDQLVAEFKKEYMEQLKNHFTALFDRISKDKDVLHDKELAKALSEMLQDEFELELDSVFDKNVKSKIDSLSKEIDRLASTPSGKLSREELAKKHFILYWLFLVNHSETGVNDETSYTGLTVKFASSLMKKLNDVYMEKIDATD
jgi:hypothetical protein